MIASSITTPTISTRASMVTLFIVKSMAFITANAPMIEVGMATAAMSVERQERMNKQHDHAGHHAAGDEVVLNLVQGGANVTRLILQDFDVDVGRQQLRGPRRAAP